MSRQPISTASWGLWSAFYLGLGLSLVLSGCGRDSATDEASLPIEVQEEHPVASSGAHGSSLATKSLPISARAVAEAALADYRQGLQTGDWAAFLARLDDDFTFHFPMGKFQGEHHGKDKAAEFFAYVVEAFPEGLEVENVAAVTASGDRVVFEFKASDKLRGQLYRNRVAISLDVCGELICGYREYFGLVGPPPVHSAP